MISIMHNYNVTNIWLDFTDEKFSNDFTTAQTSSIVLGASLCCNDCIALENSRSKTFKSGEFAGWHIKQISNPFRVTSWINSWSSWLIWVLTLSCWINNVLVSKSYLGHFSFIVGKIFSIRNDLMTSLFIDVIVSVSIVPATRLTLVLLAGSLVTNGKIPFLP